MDLFVQWPGNNMPHQNLPKELEGWYELLPQELKDEVDVVMGITVKGEFSSHPDAHIMEDIIKYSRINTYYKFYEQGRADA